ncbi:aldehyde dehydrogenase family protein [Pseudomonas aeruginosa]
MIDGLLRSLGLDPNAFRDGELAVHTPIDGSRLAAVRLEGRAAVAAKVERAEQAFRAWRQVPAPRRGELVRLFGEELRRHKAELGELVSWEGGQDHPGRPRRSPGNDRYLRLRGGPLAPVVRFDIASERPGHHMRETWHPLGVVGVISAFNFPVAVWSWNTALALVCGNSVVWKPSEKTPLTALACQALFERAARAFGGDAPAHLSQLLIGDREAGEALVDDRRVALVSATGSTRMGREVAPRVAARFARCILELGGNNAMILAPSADLDLAVRGILFGAVGTAGQRCTTLRRLIAHESVKDEIVERLKAAYSRVRIGHPLEGNLVGPLIDERSYLAMQDALARAREQGGRVFGGERQLQERYPDAYYVSPAIVEMPGQTEVVRTETFAPILYVVGYRDFDEALRLNNEVPQGLSSCIFTTDLREAELFQGAAGSDCGIANVNIGTSGAEIGGAFGGEKETGGGRESGSDAWKAYMRRQTNTVNYSRELPLAQGITFD